MARALARERSTDVWGPHVRIWVVVWTSFHTQFRRHMLQLIPDKLFAYEEKVACFVIRWDFVVLGTSDVFLTKE
jgi:hypothetical protein